MISVTTWKWVPPFARGLVRDLRVRWALEEAGIPYCTRLIAHEEKNSTEHRERQPFGQVTVLEDGELTLFESGAIVLHIGEQSETLLPNAAGAKARAITWLFADLNSVEPPIQRLAELDLFHSDTDWAPDARPTAERAVKQRLADLAPLSNRRWATTWPYSRHRKSKEWIGKEREMADRDHGVVPHLVVSDGIAAIEFYKAALGATEMARVPAEDGKRLLHATLEIDGVKLYLRDDFPEHSAGHDGGRVAAPTALDGTSITLHLDVANCDAAVDRAASAGATVTMAPQDMFWGVRYAQIIDPFGHAWSFAHPLPES